MWLCAFWCRFRYCYHPAIAATTIDAIAISVVTTGVAKREGKKCKSFFDHLYSLIRNNSLHFVVDSQPFATILTTKFYGKWLFEMNANDDGPCWFWYWCRSFAPLLNYIFAFFRLLNLHYSDSDYGTVFSPLIKRVPFILDEKMHSMKLVLKAKDTF